MPVQHSWEDTAEPIRGGAHVWYLIPIHLCCHCTHRPGYTVTNITVYSPPCPQLQQWWLYSLFSAEMGMRWGNSSSPQNDGCHPSFPLANCQTLCDVWHSVGHYIEGESLCPRKMGKEEARCVFWRGAGIRRGKLVLIHQFKVISHPQQTMKTSQFNSFRFLSGGRPPSVLWKTQMVLPIIAEHHVWDKKRG